MLTNACGRHPQRMMSFRSPCVKKIFRRQSAQNASSRTITSSSILSRNSLFASSSSSSSTSLPAHHVLQPRPTISPYLSKSITSYPTYPSTLNHRSPSGMASFSTLLVQQNTFFGRSSLLFQNTPTYHPSFFAFFQCLAYLLTSLFCDTV